MADHATHLGSIPGWTQGTPTTPTTQALCRRDLADLRRRSSCAGFLPQQPVLQARDEDDVDLAGLGELVQVVT